MPRSASGRFTQGLTASQMKCRSTPAYWIRSGRSAWTTTGATMPTRVEGSSAARSRAGASARRYASASSKQQDGPGGLAESAVARRIRARRCLRGAAARRPAIRRPATRRCRPCCRCRRRDAIDRRGSRPETLEQARQRLASVVRHHRDIHVVGKGRHLDDASVMRRASVYAGRDPAGQRRAARLRRFRKIRMIAGRDGEAAAQPVGERGEEPGALQRGAGRRAADAPRQADVPDRRPQLCSRASRGRRPVHARCHAAVPPRSPIAP